MEFVRKAFGVALNDYYPKVALVGEDFVTIPAVADVPAEYEYVLEPAEKVTGEDMFVIQTNDGTVVLKATETFLEVLTATPVAGGTINYPTAGGAMATDIVIQFSENIQAVDLASVTLVENPAATPVDISASATVLNDTLTISGPTIATGQTELVLTIPVGAFSGDPSENVLESVYTITYVAAGV
jgi:hypothetical protein